MNTIIPDAKGKIYDESVVFGSRGGGKSVTQIKILVDKCNDLQQQLKAEQEAHNVSRERLREYIDLVDDKIVDHIKKGSVNVFALHAEDEEMAQQMEKLVKFQLDRMFTAVEDLKAERDAHQALRQRLEEIEFVDTSLGGNELCPGCGRRNRHEPDCWLAAEINKGKVAR